LIKKYFPFNPPKIFDSSAVIVRNLKGRKERKYSRKRNKNITFHRSQANSMP